MLNQSFVKELAKPTQKIDVKKIPTLPKKKTQCKTQHSQIKKQRDNDNQTIH
jgi:hypothetical protein